MSLKQSVIKRSGKEEGKVREQFDLSENLRLFLVSELNYRLDKREKSAASQDLYAHNNWQLIQADMNGYRRAISELVLMLEN